jgi:hypothetical protein
MYCADRIEEVQHLFGAFLPILPCGAAYSPLAQRKAEKEKRAKGIAVKKWGKAIQMKNGLIKRQDRQKDLSR